MIFLLIQRRDAVACRVLSASHWSLFKVGSTLVISLASNQRDHTPSPESVTTLKKKMKKNLTTTRNWILKNPSQLQPSLLYGSWFRPENISESFLQGALLAPLLPHETIAESSCFCFRFCFLYAPMLGTGDAYLRRISLCLIAGPLAPYHDKSGCTCSLPPDTGRAIGSFISQSLCLLVVCSFSKLI